MRRTPDKRARLNPRCTLEHQYPRNCRRFSRLFLPAQEKRVRPPFEIPFKSLSLQQLDEPGVGFQGFQLRVGFQPVSQFRLPLDGLREQVERSVAPDGQPGGGVDPRGLQERVAVDRPESCQLVGIGSRGRGSLAADSQKRSAR